jgi:hypothetical protein
VSSTPPPHRPSPAALAGSAVLTRLAHAPAPAALARADGAPVVPGPTPPAPATGIGPVPPADPGGGQRRCPTCGGRVPERLSASGRRRRGRPRVFCSERCRLGDRRNRSAVDPALRREQVDAFAAAVRAAIEASGLSLRALEKLLLDSYGGPLASSVATLSAWQTGVSAPPRTLTGRSRVLALERCLGLPAGDLALLMPGGAVVPPPRPPSRLDGLASRWARLEHLVTSGSGPHQVLPVSLTKDHRLGASRRPLCTRVTLEVRAAHDGVDRYWFLDATDARLDPTVVDVTGCRAGERVAEPRGPVPVPPDLRLTALELLFDRPLARGERHSFSFLVQYDTEQALPRTLPLFRHIEVQPCEWIDLTVSFDRRSVPDEVRQCRWRQRDLAETWSRSKTRPGCLDYQLVVTDPAPGGYGWRWRWGPALDSVAGVARRPRTDPTAA